MNRHSPRLRILATLTALSLSACGPAPTSHPNTQPPGPSASPASPAPSAAPSGTPVPQARAPFTLRLAADSSLAGFALKHEAAFALCLSRIASARTRISFEGSLDAGTSTALSAKGARISESGGQTLVEIDSALSLQTLLAGIELEFGMLPAGPISGRSTFRDAEGAELGFVGWQASQLPSGNRVTVTLAASDETRAGDLCPLLNASVSGGSLSVTGGQPGSSPQPGPSPTATSPKPGAPLNLRVVEKAGDYLILQWDFHPDARSHTLYLDGKAVATGHSYPNYYRFVGLTPNTSYTLGVQSVNESGESEVASLSTATISGRQASGNFSGGGNGGGGRSTPDACPTRYPVVEDPLVNSTTLSSQWDPDVASDRDGDFVVVWSTDDQDGNGYGISGQRFARDGEKRGSEFQINAYTDQDQDSPAVAMNQNGDFVVVWDGDGNGDQDGIFARIYHADGSSDASEFLVNTPTTAMQESPDVAIDEDGNFVVVWQDAQGPSSTDRIMGRAYEADGTPLGDEFIVYMYSAANHHDPAIAMSESGDYVVTWSGLGTGDNDGIFARYYSDEGQISDPFRVNQVTLNAQSEADVAMDEDGHFVVVWRSDNDPDSGTPDIKARLFRNDTEPRGDEYQISPDFELGNESGARVAIKPDGSFAVVWNSDFRDGVDVFGAEFDADGELSESLGRINAITAGVQNAPAIAMDSQGDLMIPWVDESGTDGEDKGIYFDLVNHRCD